MVLRNAWLRGQDSFACGFLPLCEKLGPKVVMSLWSRLLLLVIYWNIYFV